MFGQIEINYYVHRDSFLAIFVINCGDGAMALYLEYTDYSLILIIFDILSTYICLYNTYIHTYIMCFVSFVIRLLSDAIKMQCTCAIAICNVSILLLNFVICSLLMTKH